MKIGILTWYFAINYGARAHSLGLYKTLTDLGHECEFIQYYSSNSFMRDFYSSTAVKHRYLHPWLTLQGMIKLQKFNSQRKDYPVSKKVSTAEEIDNLGYDLIVIGSDEIINIEHPLYNDVYYGVGLNKTPYITYAVSAGTVNKNCDLSDSICKSLTAAKAISVRDANTAELINHNIKKMPQIVLDPTLLHEYAVGDPIISDDYILIYSFGYLEKQKDRILQLAKDKKMKMVCVGRACSWADKSILAADLSEWLNLYKYSKFVVTDSYHGFIFAIKNRKNYILIAKGNKTNKIDGLLDLIHANRRYLADEENIIAYVDDAINYDEIFVNLKACRKEAIEYLHRAGI